VRKFRWGILGTGTIARQFVEGLGYLPDVEVFAVGSRSEASAAQFSDERGIPRRYSDYEELAADPDVDVVYVATPHPFHAPNCASEQARPCSARSPLPSTPLRQNGSSGSPGRKDSS
jgi:predicted dehydrogenase